MIAVYIMAGVAFASWITVGIGVCRIIVGMGVLDKRRSGDQLFISMKARRDRATLDFYQALSSPKFRVERWLIMGGGVTFAGLIYSVNIFGTFAPSCTPELAVWCVNRS